MDKIYHITTNEQWAAAVAKEVYDFCALKTDGYIHCSSHAQVISTANNFFKGVDDLIVLQVGTGDLHSEVRFENLEGGTEQFPHIYGPIELHAVTGFYELVKNDQGQFCTLRKIGGR